jgi:hypothetical protein
MRSFFVKTLTGSGTLSLLIPAKPSLKTSAATPITLDPKAAQQPPWYLGLLDWIIPTAAAESRNINESVEGVHERDLQIHELEQAIKAKQAWKVQLIAEIPEKSLRDTSNWLGQIPGAEIGFDISDLWELSPMTPYLTIVFPHPDWGAQAGNYGTDYHPADDGSKAARTWAFEIRTDQAGQTVFLGWEGDPAILKRCTVTDPVSRRVFKLNDPKYRFGMPVLMTGQVKSLIWRYKGDPQDDE